MDPSIVQKTKDTLGKIVTKPPLTEKLLSRPPFKYLHDIISAVIKTSGFYNGMYSPQEMDVKNVQDKEAKIAYLQKAIDALSFTIGEVIRTKPSKIVAGQDAEKTNEFLQLLGTAVLNKMDSTEGVRKVLNGEKPSDSKKKSSEKPAAEATGDSSRDRPKTVRSSRRGKEGAEADSKEQLEESSKPHKSKRGAEGGTTDSPKASRSKVKTVKAKEGGESTSKSKKDGDSKSKGGAEAKVDEEPASKTKKHKERDKEKKEKDKDKDKDVDEQGATGTSKESKKKKHKEEVKDDLQGEDSGLLARPVHKVRKKKPSKEVEQKTLDEPSGGQAETGDADADKNQDKDRPHSAKGGRKRKKKQKVGSPSGSPVPPPAEDPSDAKLDIGEAGILASGDVPSTVIMDTPGGEEDEGGMDDDNMFVVEDSTPISAPSAAFNTDRNTNDKPEGALTKTIVAMKEHLEGDLDKDTAQTAALPAISEAQRRKEREIVTKEIDKLQNTIQVLCKSANPLGKIMDYVQEDMDSMQKELEMWQSENVKHMQSLQNEQTATQQELQPLRTMLEELDAKIREQEEMIGAVKANILKNDVKTQQMLHTLTFGSH